MKKRKGIKKIAEFKLEDVVGVVTFKGKLVIVTTKGAYMYPASKNRLGAGGL